MGLISMIITQFTTIGPKWYPFNCNERRSPGRYVSTDSWIRVLIDRKLVKFSRKTYSLKPSNIFWFFLSTRSSFPSFVGPFLATEVIFKLSKHSENKNFFVPWLYLNRMFFSFECYKVSHLSRELPWFNIIN